jgi:hypothetical protein
MTTDQQPPDRLSTNQRSPHYDAALLERGVGIRFNGVEKTTVEEYCISEGWIRMAVGKARDRHGNPTLMTLKGKVEAWFLDARPGAATEGEPNAEGPNAEGPNAEVRPD